jgi:hypothetical protein
MLEYQTWEDPYIDTYADIMFTYHLSQAVDFGQFLNLTPSKIPSDYTWISWVLELDSLVR